MKTIVIELNDIIYNAMETMAPESFNHTKGDIINALIYIGSNYLREKEPTEASMLLLGAVQILRNVEESINND